MRYLISLLSIIIILLVATSIYFGTQAMYKQQAFDLATTRHQEELAFQIAEKLDKGMFERYKDIQIVAEIPTIRSVKATNTEKRIIIEKLQSEYEYYAWIGITDLKGMVISSTGGLLEKADVSQRPWFKEAITKPFVGDVHEAVLLAKLLPNPTSEPLRFIDVTSPIKDSVTSEIIGVLGAHLSWQWLREVSTSTISIQEQKTTEVLILDKENTVLVGPAGVLHQKYQAPANTTTAIAETRGYRNYPGLGWKVVIQKTKE